VRRIHGDKGYRGHNYPDRFKVWISGQVRRVTKAICREMRRRAAVEPVIGHLKDDIGCGATILNPDMATGSQCRARSRRLQLQHALALVREAFARIATRLRFFKTLLRVRALRVRVSSSIPPRFVATGPDWLGYLLAT
jgi:hypothetical protein